jgi:hypothetical protein
MIYKDELLITSYRPVPPPVPGGPQEPWGPSRVVREMAPGPGGGVKELRAPRRSGPPALLLAQAPVQGSPRAPRGPPGGPQGSLEDPRAPAGIPRAPGEPPRT